MAKISLDQLRKAASSGRRSTLYYWMREHHARISEALADAGRPNWEALAETFVKAGLTDRRNKPADSGSRAPDLEQGPHRARQATNDRADEAISRRVDDSHPPGAATSPARRDDRPRPRAELHLHSGHAQESAHRGDRIMASTSTPPRPSVIPFRPAARSTTGPVSRALPPSATAAVSVTRPDAIDLTGRRKVWFVCGRGKTGKTTLVRWVAERMEDLGGAAIVAACDPVNRSLRRFLQGVAEPLSSDSEEVKDWLWSLLHAAMESKSDALIDLGGGNSSLTALLAQLPNLANILSEGGVEPIAIYSVG